MKRDISEGPYVFTPKRALVTVFCLSPLFFILDHVYGTRTATGACICLTMVLAAAWMRWDLRHHVWYWIIIVLAILLQVPLVQLFPWERRTISPFSVYPVGMLDVAIVYGCLKLAEKVTTKKSISSADS